MHILASLTTVLLAAAPPDTVPCTLPRNLEGFVELRGDRWPIRLTRGSAPSDSLLLDLPELVMARHPVPGRCEGGTLTVTLPFGLSEVALTRGDRGEVAGSAAVGSHELRLSLHPGSPAPYTMSQVAFHNGDVELHGSLYLPPGTGRHPGIVVAHGSGPTTRANWSYRSWADFFVRRGIATLVYDKRGAGASTGDFERDSAFTGLAGDLAAAVRMLRQHDRVAASEVGVAGHSQAGWVALRAARDAPPAFLVLLAAPAVSVAEQEVQRVRYGMVAEGYDSTAVAAAAAHTRLVLATASSGRGWDTLRTSSARADGAAWREWVHRPGSPEETRWWSTHAEVDPAELLRDCRMPILAIFSDADPLVPAQENADTMQSLMERCPPASRVVVVDRADHRLELPAGRDPAGAWRLPRMHPAAVDAIGTWLDELLPRRVRW